MPMPEKAQIIQVPNTLRAKVGGRLGAIDAEAISRAHKSQSAYGETLAGATASIEAADGAKGLKALVTTLTTACTT